MNEILHLVYEMAPYLLLGFMLAGIMHAFVPNTIYKKYLGGNTWRSIINAILLGIPLPLCSCGTIPTAMSIRKEGASKGTTTAFLISTPQTGIDSIIATYSLLGLPFALIRPFAAIFTAIIGGLLVNRVERKEENQARENSHMKVGSEQKPIGQKIKIALHYAFVEMIQDIGKWLTLGLLIAGAITVFVPDKYFAIVADNTLMSMIIVLLFSLPMYICATGSIPIAAALIMKGLSPGTALVLLLAGPAVNIASMMVISKVMGRKTIVTYLIAIIGGAMLFGLMTDLLLPREWFTESVTMMKTCCEHETMIFNQICTIILFILLVNAFLLRYRKDSCHCHDNCECRKADNNSIIVHIDGMMCNHCKSNAEKAIRSVDGVDDVEIVLTTGIASIKGNANINDIKKAVEAIGFVVKE